MCAIAGLITRDGRPADEAIVGRMAEIMRHRGPDASGTWAEGPAALGHRRLKIIDLSDRAAQPMVTDDGRHVIVFNGEIYNFRDLRRMLIGMGRRFHSQSDTEVLLQLYAACGGRELLERVNGIFAFAIWDRVERTLFAARDHMGVKPFYYAADGRRFLFASEAKTFSAAGWDMRLDPSSVPEHLAFGCVAGERTVFAGIHRLLPGHWLELNGEGALSVHCYFRPTDVEMEPAPGFAAAARRLRQNLELAVDRQMVADVPVGCTCSGGLDSSSLTALTTRLTPGTPAYSASVRVPGADEAREARAVSEHCGAPHHEVACDEEDLFRLLPALTWAHDEPIRYRCSVATYLVARRAREDVTVLVCGEGADELFGGYWYYRRAHLVDRLRRFAPRSLLRLGRRVRPHSATAALASTPDEMLVRLRGTCEPEQLQQLTPGLAPEWPVRLELAREAREAASDDLLQAALLYDQTSLLPSLLACQDRMSMAASIETSVPFLDVDIVRLANGLPMEYKLRHGVEKAVLRAAMEGALPEPILKRPKHAFDVPLGRWMSRSGDLLTRTVADGELVRCGLVSRTAVDTLIGSLAQRVDSAKSDLLWNLLTLEVWYSVFVSRKVSPEPMIDVLGDAGAAKPISASLGASAF